MSIPGLALVEVRPRRPCGKTGLYRSPAEGSRDPLSRKARPSCCPDESSRQNHKTGISTRCLVPPQPPAIGVRFIPSDSRMIPEQDFKTDQFHPLAMTEQRVNFRLLAKREYWRINPKGTGTLIHWGDSQLKWIILRL
jgi:hypothetical protein